MAVNKKLAEELFLKVYRMELDCEEPHRIWAYRRAAWGVDELQESILGIYHRRGLASLREVPGVGQSILKMIEEMLGSGALEASPAED